MAHGAQELGINLSFSLSQVFEMGQLAIYENVEDLPNVEATASKILDGYSPLYLLSTTAATTPTLTGRSTARCSIQMGLWEDTVAAATGSDPPVRQVLISGAYINSVSYNFPVDDNFNESVTWVANDLFWSNSSGAPAQASFPNLDTTFLGGDTPLSANGSGGINRRENIIFGPAPTLALESGLDRNGISRAANCTVLPLDIPGISSSGINLLNSDGFYTANVQSISVSVDFGREDILQLGSRGPFFKFLQTPTEVTTSIDVHAVSGAAVSATQVGVYAGTAGLCTDRYNLVARTIRIATCEGLRLYLGYANKLTSVNDQGGGTDGSNRTTTFAYSNFNDFTVGHFSDPNAVLRPTGDNLSTYFAPS